MRSSRSRRMPGPRLTTQTSRSGTGPGSRTSPACWTCPPGRPGCGSSSARSARTRGRSCGHRPRRAPVHRVRHRRQERPARGPGTAAPPPGPLRGPIRCAKDTGLRNLPSEGVRPQPASVRDRGPGLRAAGLDPAARPGGEARRWEPRRLRLRLFAVAGRLVRGGRRLRLRLAARWRWAGQITTAVIRLQAIPSGCPDTLSGDGRVVSSMTRLSDRAICGAATSPAGTKPAV
jgi:hypothetical protein